MVCLQIVLRINCLSTEFSSQKGVKGIPLHLVVDTYEDLDTDKCEPAHRGYCRVKIFRDKVRAGRVGGGGGNCAGDHVQFPDPEGS